MDSGNCDFGMKLELTSFKPICRCCLNSSKRSYEDLFKYSALISDLTGISITDADGLPKWLCMECGYLLKKAVKFKMQILQVHSVLCNYLSRCAPFPIDCSDPEVAKYAAPSLSCTNTLAFDTLGRGWHGFHEVLEHSRSGPNSLELVTLDGAGLNAGGVKEETGFSDYEDNITLDEYKTSIDKLSDESLANLLQDSDSFDMTESNGKKRKKKREGREKKRRHDASTLEILPLSRIGRAPELIEFSIPPPLSCSGTLSFDTLGRGKNGYHKVLEHSKSSRLESGEGAGLKEEGRGGFSDCEDDIPLEEYKSTIDKLSDDSLANLLQDSDSYDVKVAEDNKKRKKKKEGKEKKRRKNEEDTTDTPVVSNIRRTIEIDPTKIKIIDLDPIEQVNQRKAESEGYMKLPYKCELCYKGFNFQDKLDNHMKKHSPSRGKFPCVLCRMHLPTPHSRAVHMLIHTRRYECLKCGRRMIDRNSIIEHYKVQHEGIVSQFTCHLCGKVSSNNKTHRGHMRNHHSGDRPKCGQCGKTFINKDSLAEHLLIHQGIKNHECAQCQKRFRTKTQLKYHQLKHTDVKDFYCVECDARFKSAHNLRQHLLKSLKHKDVKSFKFPCPQCDKRFETTTRRDTHIAIQHHGRRPHTCDICGAALSTRASLLKHVRSHRGAPPVKSHVCHACGRAFSGASNLANHARTHTGEKPFACARCGRAFSQRTAMLTHVKLVHLKVKRGTKVKPEILEPEKALKFTEEMPQERQLLPPTLPVYGDAWLHTPSY